MIRYARTGDRPAITAVLEAAFGRPDEAGLVERLRADEDVIFELVSEEAGEVNGHILFSRLWADSHGLYGALAPLAVRPRGQRTGIGSALVHAGLDAAREFGCYGVLVLGDPAYYGHFGFSAQAAAGVKAPYQGVAAFQALALQDAAFDRPITVAYPDAFSG